MSPSGASRLQSTLRSRYAPAGRGWLAPTGSWLKTKIRLYRDFHFSSHFIKYISEYPELKQSLG